MASRSALCGRPTTPFVQRFEMLTVIRAEVLRAALKRGGIWFVDVYGTPTQFFHRSCFPR